VGDRWVIGTGERGEDQSVGLGRLNFRAGGGERGFGMRKVRRGLEGRGLVCGE